MSGASTKLVVYAKRLNWIAAVVIVALLTFQYFRTSEVDRPQPRVLTNSAKSVVREAAAPALGKTRSRSNYGETKPYSVPPVVAPSKNSSAPPKAAPPPAPPVVDPMKNDRDRDGTVDGLDECPDEKALIHKREYFADTDADGKGDPSKPILSCTTTPPTGAVASKDDECPSNAKKSTVGECGCDCDYDGVDTDEDGIVDCLQLGSNEKLNRDTDGWKPDYASAQSIKALCASLKEVADDAWEIRLALERLAEIEREKAGSIALKDYSAELLTQFKKLQVLGAKLFQLQKAQFDRSKDPANTVNASSFARRLWPGVDVAKVGAVPKVAKQWLVIVEELVAITDATETMRGYFMRAAEQQADKPTGSMTSRMLADWKKAVDRCFDDARNELKATSKVLLDREKLEVEIALAGGRP